MNGVLTTIIIGIVTTTICAIGTALCKKLGYIDFFRYWKSKHRIRQAGIVTFFQKRFYLEKDVGPISNYIRKAKLSVKYVGLYLFGALNQQGIVDVVTEQINKNVEFVFCVISPETPFLAAYANFLGISESDVKSKINATLESLSRIKNSLERNKQGKLRIKTHKKMITTSFWVIDECQKGSLIQLDHKIPVSARNDSYGFEVLYRKHIKRNEFYNTIANKYIPIIDNAEEYVVGEVQ